MIYRISPTGSAPVEFEGRLVATASSEGSRSHTLTVYQTQAGLWVVVDDWKSTWAPEPSHCDAVICEQFHGVLNVLDFWDPCRHLVGFPVTQNYDRRQAALRRKVIQGYRQAVSELLAKIPEAVQRVE